LRLYLIPSPIGNLGDISYRAVAIMQQADGILCEDTRTSSVLLRHYNIQKPLTPYHAHNEHKILPYLVEQMQGGKTYALLTDAGTPAISDPGFLLVRECIEMRYPWNACRVLRHLYLHWFNLAFLQTGLFLKVFYP
jgi:16S rRNA (cytidine1402-2'-O)-methyltransferase